MADGITRRRLLKAGNDVEPIDRHWTDAGAPVGVMFAGRFGDEAILFRLAAQLEGARSWLDRIPKI